MKRKLGIFFLIGVTALAGTQEAARQFAGLKSSVSELTRAGLWSGLIVYAQPVTDGKLPSPQIYYLIPQPQTVPDARGALLVDNRPNDNPATPEPVAKNNHAAEEVASNTDIPVMAAPREVAAAVKPELLIDKLPLNLIASHLEPPSPPPAPKLAKKRGDVEVAKRESFARKFNKHAEVIAKIFVKEFDEARLEAELARLAAAQEGLETAKLKSSVAPEKDSPRRIELRILRRPVRPERTERRKVRHSFAEQRVIVLPDISNIGCEKAATAKAAAPSVTTEVKIAVEPLAVEPAGSVILLPASTNWALGCDSEPEQK